MSKYDRLWDYIAKQEKSLLMTFDDIEIKGGAAVDHSFLNSKKELLSRGFKVGKISMKNKTVEFIKN